MLPVLFETSFFTLYAYPLFMGLAWGTGFYLTQFLLARDHFKTHFLPLFFSGLFASSWLGAKFFFLLFSSKEHMREYFYADAFWLGGGFVFYGGLIFALLFYLIYSLWLKKFPFKESRYLAPGLAFGHGMGRVGCFFTGCCYGSQCSLPWAIRMHGEFRHPVQLYEALGLFILGFFALKWLREKRGGVFIFTRYLLCYSALRFSLEFFRGDAIRGVYGPGLSTSQIISMAIFVVTGFFVMKSFWGKKA